MAWAFETKAGFGWAITITILFLLSVWATVAYQNLAPLIVPVLAYIGFIAWVNRVK